ncbi:MAG: hypothetical protein GF418_06655 [Chitinivibrionales bacterium]|nr:hypothetical protein [Chitinivibrionales bacterium]MBD3395291.1 hypothetical protein [Chitinivibrionales bacterium]
MGFIDMAKQIEQEGIQHYHRLAEETPYREMAGIFEYLAREEQRHYDIFDAWQKKHKAPEIERTDIAQRAKKVFERLTKDIDSLGVAAIDQDDAYYKALTLEKNSVSVYTEMLAKTQSPEQEKQLHFIIGQEESHMRLVQSLMEFQRHPHEWLENAEWHHFDEY